MESIFPSIFKYKRLIIGVGIVVFSGVIGSAYYLFNIFHYDVNITDDQKMQIEEIKEEIEETNGELTVETAIQILSLITNISDDIFKKFKSDIHQRRRSAIKKTEEYIQLCKETFSLKEKALSDATRKVMYQLGNISYEKIQRIIKKVSPYELEFITYKFNQPSFEEKSLPDKVTVKEAFRFYAKRLKEEMKKFYDENESNKNGDDDSKINITNFRIRNYSDNSLIFKLLVIKLKVDDELFLKFKYSEDQIRYLLYEYQLFEDNEVRKLYEDVSSVLV